MVVPEALAVPCAGVLTTVRLVIEPVVLVVMTLLAEFWVTVWLTLFAVGGAGKTVTEIVVE